MGGEGHGENRCKRGDRAVHQPCKARLDIGEDKLAAFALCLDLLHRFRYVFETQTMRQRGMILFGNRQIAKQFSGIRIPAKLDRGLVKPLRLPLHRLGGLADFFDRKRPR